MRNFITYLFILLGFSLWSQSPATTSLTFSLANPQVINGGNDFQFDVQLSADNAGTYHALGTVYIEYNTEGFGSSIASNITVDKLALLDGLFAGVINFYDFVNITNNSPNTIAITWETNLPTLAPSAATHNEVPLNTPTDLMRVTMPIADPTENAGLQYIAILMNGEQFGQIAPNTNEAYLNPNIYANNLLNTPLPIELLAFSVEPQKSSIQLNWTSVNEVSFLGYELERSTDGKNFQNIHWQPGIGGKNVQLYSYDDVSVQKNVLYYYRLKMIDDQDSFEYSNVLSAIIHGDDSDFRIYPNPASDLFTLEIFSPNEGSQVFIYDNLGKEVDSYIIEHAGLNKLNILTENFSKGVYQVILRRKDGVSLIKQLIIVK